MKKSKQLNFCVALLAMLCVSIIGLRASDERVSRAQPALIPAPQSVEWKEQAVPLKSVKIILPDIKGDKLRGSQMKTELKEILVLNNIKMNQKSNTQVRLRLGKVETPNQWAGQEDEAYELVACKDGVVITANTVTGLYRGVQTLRQLVVTKEGKTSIAMCEILDYPAFKIRGYMHDVGRNFQSIEQLKMQIDVMAAYKYSVFHWHLTDHFGWRLESQKYPELQSKKAFGRHHGKFYTQEEFKEMSDYCWARGIIIIPEFDSPGHSEAFRHGLEIPNMKDPRALEAMIGVFDELCTLADKERMPYIHVGTDEVRHKDEFVDAHYLPELHKAIHKNDRELIGWVQGMTVKGDTKQIQQTWAQCRPHKHLRHIDSRSNYVNHLESLDFMPRMLFQQPCRVPHGSDVNLGGILAHWPDTLVEDEKLSLTNNPIIPSIVAYSEAVWKGIEKDRSDLWSRLPDAGTPEFEAYADFENRIAEQRDRFLGHTPFLMVKTHHIQWRLLGPVSNDEVPELDRQILKNSYDVDGKAYNWTKSVFGAAIHSRHSFGFGGYFPNPAKGKDVVWGNTYVYSPKDQELDAWISFNTISSSDDRAGSAKAGDWNANPACNIWINGKRVAPPKWKNPGVRGKEIALIDNVYTSRAPSKIQLKKGWNSVLMKSARRYKWHFSFSPIQKDGDVYREVEELKYSATPPAN